ncbi:MAG TPA: hypothetical protein VFQ58_10500 [Flavisolibacter sp.]|nr:hypothetical protein [Flavisolibacter sp.]
MMKTGLLVFFLPLYVSAQKIETKGDTVIYNHQKYFIGKEIQFGYGSASNKDFDYIFWGMHDDPSNPIDGKWANTIVEVEKIYSILDKVYLKCRTSSVRNNFHIDVREAVDHHEIKM